MFQRVLVSVIGIPILFWIALAGPVEVIVFALCALAGIAALELVKCVGIEENSFLAKFTPVMALLSVFGVYALPDFLVAFWALYILTIFIYAIIKAREVKFVQILTGIFAVVIIPYSFAGLLRMELSGLHRAYLLLPFILSFCSDTGGFFGGKFFGKHKLAPKVSPKKTVEGSVGGVIGNMIGGVVFALVMNHFCGENINYLAIVLLAAVCSAIAQIGDLSFSLIKREYGIKDYGKLFLEHGGVLDRFDSVLFVTPIVEMVLRFLK